MMEKKSFWEYITSSAKDPANADPFQIVMLSQLLGRVITILYGNGEKWTTDQNMKDDIVLVYKGDGEFLPTDVGTYLIFFLIMLNCILCQRQLNLRLIV